jgi:hypothetical protein
VTDPRCDRAPVLNSGDTNGDGVLETSETWAFSCPHKITASDPNPLPNTAVASGTNAGTTVTASASHILDIIHPAIHITKSGPASANQGSVITYTFAVTNTGDVTLGNVTVTDDKLGFVGTIASLAPGATQSLTKNFTVPSTGVVDNTGTACGADPLGLEVCDTDAHHLIITSVLGTTISQPESALPGTGTSVLPGSTLPRTGVNISLQVLLAGLLLALGLLLSRVGRRSTGFVAERTAHRSP